MTIIAITGACFVAARAQQAEQAEVNGSPRLSRSRKRTRYSRNHFVENRCIVNSILLIRILIPSAFAQEHAHQTQSV
jgi:hypothetical protein